MEYLRKTMRDYRIAGNAAATRTVYFSIRSLSCHNCANLIGEMIIIDL
jgi:hypothetical protein